MQLLYYLRDMAQLLLSPLKGWEDVETDAFEAKTLLLKGLLPFLAITALTVFVKLFYVADIHWIALIEQAIVCFMKFFVGYFVASFCFTLYLPECIEGEISVNNCHTFIIYAIGMLALINIFQNLLPIDIAIVYVMPVYVLYVMWRGLRYLRISFTGVTKFLLLDIFSVIAPPYLLQYLFDFIIPA